MPTSVIYQALFDVCLLFMLSWYLVVHGGRTSSGMRPGILHACCIQHSNCQDICKIYRKLCQNNFGCSVVYCAFKYGSTTPFIHGYTMLLSNVLIFLFKKGHFNTIIFLWLVNYNRTKLSVTITILYYHYLMFNTACLSQNWPSVGSTLYENTQKNNYNSRFWKQE